MSEDDIRKLSPAAKPSVVFGSLVRSRSQLDRGVPDEDTRRLKQIVFDNSGTGIAIVNTTRTESRGTHWLAVAVLRIDNRAFHAAVIDSLNPDDKTNHRWVAEELCKLLHRCMNLDKPDAQPDRMKMLQACAEVSVARQSTSHLVCLQAESIAHGSLRKERACQSTWIALLKAIVEQGKHVLWNHEENDVGKGTVASIQLSVQPLLQQGKTVSKDVVAFLNAIKPADLEKVSQVGVWPAQFTKLQELLLSEIMSESVLAALKTAAQAVLTQTVATMSEKQANAVFLPLLTSAKSIREQLIQKWMSA